MVDILLLSLPSKWGREYIKVENYWLILLSQYINSCGYSVEIIDAALENCFMSDIEKETRQISPRLILFLTSNKNFDVVIEAYKQLAFDETFSGTLLLDETINLDLEECIESYNIDSCVLSSLKTKIVECLFDSHPKQVLQNDFTVGRKYLSSILLLGGECEVIGDISSGRNYFPSDYCYNTNNCQKVIRNFKTIISEIIFLSKNFPIRKINIIDDRIIDNIKKLDLVFSELLSNDLSYLNLGLYLDADLLDEETCKYLANHKNMIYKITFVTRHITKKQIAYYDYLKKENIKVKVLFNLFDVNTDLNYIEFVLNNVKKEIFNISPTSLISGVAQTDILCDVKSIMKYVYSKVFKELYDDIVLYENICKYDYRVGNNNNYDALTDIKKSVDERIRLVNNAFIDFYFALITHIRKKNFNKENIITLLEYFKDQFAEIRRILDEGLFDSCGI